MCCPCRRFSISFFCFNKVRTKCYFCKRPKISTNHLLHYEMYRKCLLSKFEPVITDVLSFYFFPKIIIQSTKLPLLPFYRCIKDAINAHVNLLVVSHGYWLFKWILCFCVTWLLFRVWHLDKWLRGHNRCGLYQKCFQRCDNVIHYLQHQQQLHEPLFLIESDLLSLANSEVTS